MNHHKKAVLIAVAAAFAATGTAYAAGEQAHTTAATAVNPNTCRFVTPERDPAAGPTWKNLRTYVIYEDARHDAKLACLTRHMPKPVAPQTLRYTQVTATGTGQTVTATCPAGYHVTGGGSRSETTGSYPSSNQAWTVVRDHLSPRTLDATAICMRISA